MGLGRCVFGLFLVGVSSAHAMDLRVRAALMRIEPATRLEQVCDLEAMRQISLLQGFKVDRAKSDILVPPRHQGDIIEASGAAFRSNGKWYAFSFTCKGSPDHLRVLSFEYKLGSPIASARWAELGLWR